MNPESAPVNESSHPEGCAPPTPEERLEIQRQALHKGLEVGKMLLRGWLGAAGEEPEKEPQP
jgi:hypothetical protein